MSAIEERVIKSGINESCFRRAIYHTCIFNMACAGACEYDRALSYSGLSFPDWCMCELTFFFTIFVVFGESGVFNIKKLWFETNERKQKNIKKSGKSAPLPCQELNLKFLVFLLYIFLENRKCC